MAAAGAYDVSTTARAFAKQASIDRSRAAIQGLNDAAELLRSQSDLLASCLDDSGDEAMPTPEMHKTAVQRFLSRRLSRQASRGSSHCITPPDVETSAAGANDGAATTPAASDGGNVGGSDGGRQQQAVAEVAESAVRPDGDMTRSQEESLLGFDRENGCGLTSKENEQGE